MQFTCAGTTVLFDEETLRFTFQRDGAQWTWREGFRPSLETKQGTFAFTDAAEITHEERHTGTGVGVRSVYRGFGGSAAAFDSAAASDNATSAAATSANTTSTDTTSATADAATNPAAAATAADAASTTAAGAPDFAFETYVWVEQTGGDVHFEWIPLCEDGLDVTRLHWPGEMAFDALSDRDVTLITHEQGVLVPNSWPTAVSSAHGDIVFDGRFETAGGYMPWYAQIRGGSDAGSHGYIAICETPWNAGYAIEHPTNGIAANATNATAADGDATNVAASTAANAANATNAAACTANGTSIGMWFEPSLGRMDYRRVVRYRFLSHADHTSVAKEYRAYVNERGRLRTLAEKAARNPSVRDLIGCSWVHVGIKTVVQPESRFYDHEHPEKNNALTTFAARQRQIDTLHELGAGKLYLHLDGWAQPGYDNSHPDYLPACEEAGGWAGMKALVDDCHAHGDLFGTHDQYRDYYFSAPTFDRDNAVRLTDGTNPEHSMWAGGHQTYLCAELAPDYVRRNFGEIAAHGVRLDCAYLDVFTCNEGDECANPEHRMSRRDCYARRAECFEYLLSHGILSSSEEVSDWAVPSLVFCHYAPYDFQMRSPRAPRQGVPVPLYNLVYHDCVIEPWMMDRVVGDEATGDRGDDYMLYALLNGGAPYLIRDAAYVGMDGDMDDAMRAQALDDIGRCRVVAELHEKVGMLELVRHEFVGGDPMVQRSTFADGTQVTCDLRAQTWDIAQGE